MNPRLVVCLIVSIVAAFGGAVSAVMLGWGWLAAVAIYCFGGSGVLLVTSLVAVVLEARLEKVRAEPAGRPEPAKTGAFA